MFGAYSFLGRRPFREARVRSYIAREHRHGRRLQEILEDPYVRRCGNDRFCHAVANDAETIVLLERNLRESFQECRP
ncbi:MAG TPA: hypothetical protein VFB25_08635 [Gaiellaceae bacterium]|nr:hypothetical protein [Gaiellaceae bacterium]